MQNKIEIGSWKYQNSTVSLFLSNNKKIKAKIYDVQGNFESGIPAYDMNLPKDLVKNPSVISLSTYLQNTYIHIKVREDDSVGLYINPRMHGGGWMDAIVNAVAIGSGFALTVYTGGLGTMVGAGLISAGVNGIFHAVSTEENFTQDCGKQMAGGLVSGAILGLGAVQITSGPLVSNAITFVSNNISSIGNKFVNTLSGRIGAVLTNFGGKLPNISSSNITIIIGKGAFCGLGGAASQAASSKIIDGKVDKAKVMFGAVVGCTLSVITSILSDQAEKFLKSVTKEACDKLIKQLDLNLSTEVVNGLLEKSAQEVVNTVLEVGYAEIAYRQIMSVFVGTETIMQAVNHLFLPKIKHEHQVENNKKEQEINLLKIEANVLINKLEHLNEQTNGLMKDVDELTNDLEAQKRQTERLQKQKDANKRVDPTFFGQTHSRTNNTNEINGMPSPLSRRTNT